MHRADGGTDHENFTGEVVASHNRYLEAIDPVDGYAWFYFPLLGKKGYAHTVTAFDEGYFYLDCNPGSFHIYKHRNVSLAPEDQPKCAFCMRKLTEAVTAKLRGR